MRYVWFACFSFISILNAAEPTLESKLKPIAEAHKGSVGYAVKNLATGEVTQHSADTVMPTASLIKVAIMVEAYIQADEGKLNLDKTITLNKDDKVQGSGILTSHFSDGATFPVKDAIRLMMAYSDNTATNLVLDQTGIKQVNDRMAKLGLENTRINAKVFKGSTTSVDPDRTKKYGLGSTTPMECLKLMEMIHDHKVAKPESCKLMIAHLRTCTDKDTVVSLLPAGTKVAHKGGAVLAVRTNAAIIEVPTKADPKKTNPVIVVVMTDNNEDQRWTVDNQGQVTIAKIAKEVYDWYAK